VHSISRWTVVRETLAIRDVAGPKTNRFGRGGGDLQGRDVLPQPQAAGQASKRTRSRSVVFATPLLTFVVTDGLFRVFRALSRQCVVH
jgi:hypothetical protein